MKAKQFEQKHGLGKNNGYYYKRIWKHLFPESDPHDYSNASLYLTYIHKLRNMVADTLVDKEPIDIYEFFGGNANHLHAINIYQNHICNKKKTH